jgi:hypothetical protein
VESREEGEGKGRRGKEKGKEFKWKLREAGGGLSPLLFSLLAAGQVPIYF